MKIAQLFLFLLISTIPAFGQERLQFPSEDGLQVSADYYPADSKKMIILFHQAMYSRGSYLEIAPKLNALGYSCLAVDLRSGGPVNSTPNLTCKAAKQKGLATKYMDAYQDVRASIAFVKKTYKPTQVLVLGSSYSSSLVLKFGGEYPHEVAGILAFSPGEYFKDKSFIQKTASSIQVPVFITSKTSEQKNWQKIYDNIPTEYRNYFVPKSGGHHGAKALWNKFDDSSAYWDAMTHFLKKIH